MAISERHRFLIAAAGATGAGDYFGWRSVGTSLGWSDVQAQQAVASLETQRLVIALQDGQARLLSAGRVLAERLAAQSPERRGRRMP